MTVTCVVSHTINCRQGGGWRRRRRQSELTDFSGRIRGHELSAPMAARIRGHELSGRIRGHGLSAPMAARIRAHELSAPIRGHGLSAPAAPIRAREWNSQRRSELTNGIRGWLDNFSGDLYGGWLAGRIQIENILVAHLDGEPGRS